VRFEAPSFFEALDFLVGLPTAFISFIALLVSLQSWSYAVGMMSLVTFYAGARLTTSSVMRASQRIQNTEDG